MMEWNHGSMGEAWLTNGMEWSSLVIWRFVLETFWKRREASFGDILEAGRPDEARWGLEGSRAILIGKTHAIVRVTTISLESGEPRTLKYCKNTYEMSVQNCPAARPTFDWPNSPPEPLQDKPVWGICIYIYIYTHYNSRVAR